MLNPRALAAVSFSLLLSFVAAIAAPAAAQARVLTKAEKVAAIIEARDAGERRLMQRLAPATVKSQVKATLAKIGAQHALGPAWNAEAPQWRQAEAVIAADLQRSLTGETAKGRQAKANLAEQIGLLPDAYVDEIHAYYTGSMYEKTLAVTERLTNSFMALAALMEEVNQPGKVTEANEKEFMDRLGRLKDANRLSPEDERVMRAMDSPAMRALNRVAINPQEIFEAISQETRLSSEAATKVDALVAAFRAERTLPPSATPPIQAERPKPAKGELNALLMQAVKELDIAQVKSLVAQGADVNALVGPNDRNAEATLHQAARSGSTELAGELLKLGANVNVAGKFGFTPLHVASGLNRLAMVEYLLANGADVNAREYSGTPIHAAAVQGHEAVVALLIRKGADVNALSQSMRGTPLHTVTMVSNFYPSHIGIVRRLAEAGTDLFAKDKNGNAALYGLFRKSPEAARALLESKAQLETSGPRPQSVLPYLHSAGRDMVNRGLERGLSLEGRDVGGLTLLHVAVRRSDPYMVADLVRKPGLQIDARDDRMQTPLFDAVGQNQDDIVPALLDLGADVNARNADEVSVLARAIQVARAETASVLIQRGAAVNVSDARGLTPLHVAARGHDPDKVLLLLLHGAKVDAVDSTGATPLHFVTHSKVATALLDGGADVNAQNLKGEPPLFSAVTNNGTDVSIAELLRLKGAKPEVRAKDGSTLLHVAAARSGEKPLAWALAQISDPNVRTIGGKTPLHMAAGTDNYSSVVTLLKKGADPNALDEEGNSPLHITAARSGGNAIGPLLLTNGAKADVANRSGATPLSIAMQRQTQDRRLQDALQKAMGK